MKTNKPSFINLLPPRGEVGRGAIWLFLELVVITVVAWVVFDPAIVNLYHRCLPLGYDTSHLLYGEYKASLSEDETDKEQIDIYDHGEEFRKQIERQLTAVEGVESVNLYENEYRSIGYRNYAYELCRNEGDSLYLVCIEFIPDLHFFETYGLKPLSGSPSAEQLSRITQNDQQVVLTRSGAIALFGTEDVVGRQFTICYDHPYPVTVAGVVEDIRQMVSNTIRSLIFVPRSPNVRQYKLVIRLKKDVDTHRFLEEHGPELIRSGRTCISRIKKLMTYDEHIQQQELDEGHPQEVNRSLALAFFFLVNLCLAVIGTVWLQAKHRTEECGVRRAFGATRPRLLREMLWRNALLATVAVVVGLIIFLNYAHSGIESTADGQTYCEHFYNPFYYDLTTDKTWVDYFWSHFLVVSAVVYIIILCTVLIGTVIPAMKIINTKITDAIREE